MTRLQRLLALLSVAAVLGGCASGVTRMDTPAPGTSARTNGKDCRIQGDA